MASLNGARIVQGATQPFILTLSNPTADHPLNPNGFNTANYELCLVAKQNLSDADDAATAINLENSRFTASIDGLTATFSFLPTDSQGIDFGVKTELKYKFDVWIEDSTAPETHSYPIEQGSMFTLIRSTKNS